MPAMLITHWSQMAQGDDDIEPLKKHAEYAKFVRSVAGEHMPWLFPLLDAANAAVLCGPHMFAYKLQAHRGLIFDVPEMRQRLLMLPWDRRDEITH